jgi:DNA-binding response OmpR family regulator
MKTKKILIIDDDPEFCEELTALFKDEGYAAIGVSDAKRVETLLKALEYDVLILDYKMPGITGTDILRKLTAEKIKKHIFIISGNPFIEKILENEGLIGAVSGTMTKPIDFEALIEKINISVK